MGPVRDVVVIVFSVTGTITSWMGENGPPSCDCSVLESPRAWSAAERNVRASRFSGSSRRTSWASRVQRANYALRKPRLLRRAGVRFAAVYVRWPLLEIVRRSRMLVHQFGLQLCCRKGSKLLYTLSSIVMASERNYWVMKCPRELSSICAIKRLRVVRPI